MNTFKKQDRNNEKIVTCSTSKSNIKNQQFSQRKSKKSKYESLMKQNIKIEKVHKNMKDKYRSVIKNIIDCKTNFFQRKTTPLNLIEIVKNHQADSVNYCQENIRRYLGNYKAQASQNMFEKFNNTQSTIISSTLHSISTSTFQNQKQQRPQTKDWQKLKNNWVDDDNKILQLIQRTIVRDQYKKLERKQARTKKSEQEIVEQKKKQQIHDTSHKFLKYRLLNQQIKEIGQLNIGYKS